MFLAHDHHATLAQSLGPGGDDGAGFERTVHLPTGTLSVRVAETDIPLDQLMGFAARRNPKRGFLFVSKVLGKHIPATPSAMARLHALLAAKIPADLPGPVVVIGMAETAICLGHGVYEQYLMQTGRQDVLFSHSTRYDLAQPKLLQFLEEHSHAADHIMYLPQDADARALFMQARSLVLVDDEASTGKTFVNLARAFKEKIPSIERLLTGVITDWRGPARAAQMLEEMPCKTSCIQVLSGRYDFASAPNLVAVKMPNVVGNSKLKDRLLPRNHGRLGLKGRYELPVAIRMQAEFIARRYADARVLVLGTGEFAYPPFLFASELERLGLDTYFQTTTRSPIMVGNAIGSAFNHTDNYEDGIANFVYNVVDEPYDLVLLVHETPSSSLDPVLVNALGARTMEM
jgi:hypothetical protein